MNPLHESTLASIERNVAGRGVATQDIDACIAGTLGVPPEYYLAYLLVSRALDDYHDSADPQRRFDGESDRLSAEADPAARAAQLLDEIASVAAAMQEEATAQGHTEVYARAGRIQHAVCPLHAVLCVLSGCGHSHPVSASQAHNRGVGVSVDGR